MHLRFAVASLLLTASGHALAAADDSVVATDGAGDAPEIVVTGKHTEYGVRSTTTATKTNTNIKDVPQAMTVVSKAQIADQSLRSIADVLMFVPGASPASGESNRDQMTLRGNNSTADFFVDGVRDDVQYFRDLYNVDRVEVLRGSNAMIFGRGGGGGIVNRVLKRPSLTTDRQFSIAGDSYGGFRIAGDVDQALGGSAGLRINGMYENGDSFRHHVDLKRYGVNPTVAIQAGPDTRIDLSYEYLHDRRTADRGVPSVSDGNQATIDKPLEGYDRTFFGDPELSYAKADVHVGSLAVQHDFGGGLLLRNRTLAGDYDKFYQNIYPSGLNGATEVVTFGAYNSRNDRQNLFNQTDLIWENQLGGIDQTLLFGFEVGRQKSRNFRQSGALADNQQPLSDVTIDADVIFSNQASDANNRTEATVGAVYAQDQIRFTSWLKLLAGVRFDSFKLKVQDFHGAGFRLSRTDHTVSPRIGVILKPQKNLSIYGSFSRSFLPQSGDQFSGLTTTTADLKPERFENLEIGAKWEPVSGLLATAAIYRLDRTNTRSTDPVTLQTVLTGAQRSKGIELGLERSMTDRWQISAGYAFQKAEITETTTAAPAGRAVPLVPRHSFSLWNRYDFTDRFGAGLGVVARTRSFASISNSVVLPGYTRVDAAGFYKITPRLQAQVNVENLLGVDYFPTTNGDNNIAPGAPRTLRATLRVGI
ncbi:MAG: TonB-dependent receptor [Sphingomicrobium sp.]